MPLNNTVYE